jgi:heat shock protein HtpX
LARQRRLNWLHSALLLLTLLGIASATGALVAGTVGLVIGTALALAFLMLDPMPGDLLFRRAFGAVQLSPAQAPGLSAMLGVLAQRAGLPYQPVLYLIPSPILQAMAAGSRKTPFVAVTLGLIQALPQRELAAVLAHEIAHIRHGDLLVLRLATVAATLTHGMATVGALGLLMLMPLFWATGTVPSPGAVLLLLVAPLLSDLLTLALSRRREFLADAGAVELTGDVTALAQALARIWHLQGDDWERLASRGPAWLRWLRTHPGVADRIAALQAMVAPSWPMPVEWGKIAAPTALRGSGGHHPAQRLARRWLL